MIPAKFTIFPCHAARGPVPPGCTYGEEAKILSGGQSLIPLLKLRPASPSYLIDINRIPGLESIAERDGYLRIGALIREADLEASQFLRTKYPMVVETSAVIADPLVRNLATLGGNLVHADPANDHPATMLALAAEVVATGPDGERTLPITEFFSGYFTTALRPDEILTEIRVPIPPARSGGTYVKLERKVGDFAIVGVAAHVSLDATGGCARAGIGLTNVGSCRSRHQAEAFLRGNALDLETIKQAALLVAEAADPEADLRGSVAYKRIWYAS